MRAHHDSAHTHVQGRSEFIDDRAPQKGELFLEILWSPHARARIKKIDTHAAEALASGVKVFLAKDFVHNAWGTIFKDQPLLAASEVHFVGEAVAIVAAETRELAARAKALVRVDYEVLPAILSIDAAKAAQSFFMEARSIERGNAEQAFATASHLIEGKIVIRGAEHFYLENQAAIAYPLEDGQIEVHSSSQHPTETQHVVAHALGLPDKDVVCIVKRMGGAFGGKESQGAPFAAYAALVAQRTGRPARCVLDKDSDMIMTGKRNPFENLYRVAFEGDGRLSALEVQLFSDGGAYADLSTSIMERAMLHCDNAYFIPHVKVLGRVCRTHFHPHTAFRGFGGPKGVATIENIIEEVARFLKMDALDVRKINRYRPGFDTTPYGQRVENNLLPELFDNLERSCDYRARREALTKHNAEAIRSDGQLRGLSLTAVKFGISFTTRFLNQANAFVIVHRDGSLQVSTGATEMGQGVNARIAALVAKELGLARDQVRIMPTRTDKNANTSPTAASSGTDLNGAAAVLAARKIKHRLSQLADALLGLDRKRWAGVTAALGTESEIAVQDINLDSSHANFGTDKLGGVATFSDISFSQGQVFRNANPSQRISFEELVHEAYHHRISLSDYAHYRIPGLSFNKVTGQGDAFLYFTQGVAASEVSIDILTGELKVLRTDILMDLGRPVLKELDLGQIYGGFVQGMGWVTSEKLFYSKEGALLTHAPSTYKIPSIHDIPRDFRVDLIPNESNFKNLQGTKAVGEPPLLLALSVWTAIQNALGYLPRYERSLARLEIPATREQILRALHVDAFAQWEA